MSHEVDVLVAANGNIRLAAERLSREGGKTVHPADLIETLQQDEDESLARGIRNALALQTYELMSDLRTVLVSELENFSPAEIMKLYGLLGESLTQLVKPVAQTSNTQNNMFFPGSPEALEAARHDLITRLGVQRSLPDGGEPVGTVEIIPRVESAGSDGPASHDAARGDLHSVVRLGAMGKTGAA